ncbi:DinB family protein [Telmatocola sphagniphila]|uniref:DinB family protein n=1 Tax=Telmatocola sphagniphila TaxID=1123043 RepID=A0A8E6B629_9BACT|nr:DinB family protein [Telmatocola sphagniphila]QVL32577.1 DinB family protein [Telmatocola sphagniphila]
MLELAAPLYTQNLAYAKRLVADLNKDQWISQPLADKDLNHPAFVIGHLGWVCDFGTTLLGHPAELPPNWKEIFGNTAKPSRDGTVYPAPEEILKAYETQHTRLTKLVLEATPEKLKEPSPERMRARFPELGQVMLHLLTNHQAVHLGQLSAWRRAFGLPSV